MAHLARLARQIAGSTRSWRSCGESASRYVATPTESEGTHHLTLRQGDRMTHLHKDPAGDPRGGRGVGVGVAIEVTEGVVVLLELVEVAHGQTDGR